MKLLDKMNAAGAGFRYWLVGTVLVALTGYTVWLYWFYNSGVWVEAYKWLFKLSYAPSGNSRIPGVYAGDTLQQGFDWATAGEQSQLVIVLSVVFAGLVLGLVSTVSVWVVKVRFNAIMGGK